MGYILGTLVYLLRGDDVLVMRRNKEPNLGLWIAPGGKVIYRKLDAIDPLRGFCTEVSPFPEWHWLLFIFVTRTFAGVLQPDVREGDLAWLPVETYLNARPIPQADTIFAPRVLQMEDGLFQAKFVYDEDLKLVTWTVY